MIHPDGHCSSGGGVAAGGRLAGGGLRGGGLRGLVLLLFRPHGLLPPPTQDSKSSNQIYWSFLGANIATLLPPAYVVM